jgi:hypothetical protein
MKTLPNLFYASGQTHGGRTMTSDHDGNEDGVSRRKVLECMTWDERGDCKTLHLHPHLAGTIVATPFVRR